MFQGWKIKIILVLFFRVFYNFTYTRIINSNTEKHMLSFLECTYILYIALLFHSQVSQASLIWICGEFTTPQFEQLSHCTGQTRAELTNSSSHAFFGNGCSLELLMKNSSQKVNVKLSGISIPFEMSASSNLTMQNYAFPLANISVKH